MPESIPATLIIDTLKDTFREARVALAAEVAEPPRHSHLGWILSVPDTHQKSVLAALHKVGDVEGNGVRITSEMVMEVEGQERPALVAEVLGIQYA